MITFPDAFKKFKSRLELNEKEQTNASKRQKEVRDHLDKAFQIDRSFLTGSYARWTKSKPLKDVDIFFVLGKSEAHYRDKHPEQILSAFHRALADQYGENAVKKQSRSVGVNFGVVVDTEDNTDYRVVSVDAVPALVNGGDYEIPDNVTGKWMGTNPEIHAKKAVEAHQAYGNEWKGLVRMVKYWNQNSRHGEKPIKPSFLIEVMAMQCLHGGWGGSHDRELQAFFATLRDRIHEDWPDPAGLGSPVSDRMDGAMIVRAQNVLDQANRDIATAINLARSGKNIEALKAWRSFFGPKFPLS
ncbi:CBASS oligonucleotide cyclase [Loktanella sp. M215]|uniref:CBASS oligonucleotide cyclase n=1 Tax=Loktanella sp. M215 TaxID=2675431 RepID=UPI001F2BB6BB|nr:nucleotidyltransferase [Loktanella sp. M215]